MEPIKIILGFDFGMKYIGIATGQLHTKTASPLTSIKAKDGIPNWQEVGKIIDTWQSKQAVVGLPYNMDGSMQHVSYAALKFAERLRDKFSIEVFMENEQLSTWEAKQHIQRSTNSQDFLKLNAAAAVVILEQWLGSCSK